MKKSLFFTILCLCGTTIGRSQQREIVLVDYFTKGPEVPVLYSERIRSEIIEGFKIRNREDVVDAEYIPQLNPIRQGGTEEREQAIYDSGARYIISGNVAGYKFTRNIPTGGSPQCVSTFKILLNGYDLSTGEKLAPEQYELTGRGSNPDESDARAIETIRAKINFYVESRMKFETPVLELCEPGTLQLYIGSGSNIGVKNGDQFIVYVLDEIQGRAVRKELGRITVRGVEGADASRCTMRKKQAPLIIEAFNSGKQLVAVSAGEAFF